MCGGVSRLHLGFMSSILSPILFLLMLVIKLLKYLSFSLILDLLLHLLEDGEAGGEQSADRVKYGVQPKPEDVEFQFENKHDDSEQCLDEIQHLKSSDSPLNYHLEDEVTEKLIVLDLLVLSEGLEEPFNFHFSGHTLLEFYNRCDDVYNVLEQDKEVLNSFRIVSINFRLLKETETSQPNNVV